MQTVKWKLKSGAEVKVVVSIGNKYRTYADDWLGEITDTVDASEWLIDIRSYVNCCEIDNCGAWPHLLPPTAPHYASLGKLALTEDTYNAINDAIKGVKASQDWQKHAEACEKLAQAQYKRNRREEMFNRAMRDR